MIRFGYLSAFATAAICTSSSLAISQDKTFAIEEVDKNKTLAEILVTKKHPCPFVFKDGKVYEACPNFKIDGLDNAIARFEAK